ncbi:unnamed protein product [Amoebophrya sp. A25]|nr:unnamed protein product [Amoebophrya sp. A25]|eukprot:GSA25T00007344001.1
MIQRYIDELYDVLQAVPRHGEMSLRGPGLFQNGVSGIVRSGAAALSQSVTNALGMKPLPGSKRVLTLKKGTVVESQNGFQRLGSFLR